MFKGNCQGQTLSCYLSTYLPSVLIFWSEIICSLCPDSLLRAFSDRVGVLRVKKKTSSASGAVSHFSSKIECPQDKCYTLQAT